MIDEPTPKSGMIRDAEDPGESRGALVKSWQGKVEEAKGHWKRDLKRMRDNMDFASGKQWDAQTENDDRYTANIVQRVIKTTVASLYAKNPRVVAKRRETLDFTIWDGKPESLQAAMMQMQAAAETGMPPSPEIMMLLQDVQQAGERWAMLDKVGRTMEILIAYYMQEQIPDFKTQMKQMVRRARTTGVGYVELGFQREMQLSDDQSTRIADMAERLAVIGRLQADLQDGETDPYCAETEELRLAIQAVENEPEMIVREGLVWSFPQSTRIIPSPETQSIVGWTGCPWLAKEVLLTVDRVKEVYGVDLGKNYNSYKVEPGRPWAGARSRHKEGGKGLACIWHIYDRDTGLEYVVCDGYNDFLQEPASPDVQVEQFYPIFAITFNEVENEGELFPKSDVELIKHMQLEYNRSKEARRQHRIAARPLYLSPEGQFDEEEQKTLAGHAAHEVIMVKGLRDGVKPQDLIAPVQKIGIDPNLYETETVFQDILRVIGVQDANIGSTGGGTATETSLAESSRNTSIGLDADDLDDMLSNVMRAAGQVLLLNMSKDKVIEIVGPGAVWPELSRAEIMREVWLEVRAGSSGRPNQAREAANFERLYPLLVQIPGITPRWLAERAVRIADDGTNLEDAFMEGLPSIMAMNRLAQQGTGDPATDPNAQGEQGGNNAEQGDGRGGQAQPGFTDGPQANQVAA